MSDISALSNSQFLSTYPSQEQLIAVSPESTVTPPATNENDDAAIVEINSTHEQSTNASRENSQPKASAGDTKLSKNEQQEVDRLKKRDHEVRAHEQAHLAGLGSYRSGGAQYTYETGPDGNRYAIDGEVPVNVSKEQTPEETIRKAQAIRRAALAPAEPSGADKSVAAQASKLEADARKDLAKKQSDLLAGTSMAATSKDTTENKNAIRLAPKPYEDESTTCSSCGATFRSSEKHNHLAVVG